MVRGLADFPVRVKTAKLADHNNLLVFRKKGLQLFIQTVPDTANEKIEVNSLMIEETLPYIRCQLDTPRQPLTSRFWPSYEKIKTYREQTLMPRSEQSLIVKAENNLRSALANYAAELEEYIPFIQTLLRDLKEYQTLPKYTLRRLTVIEMNEKVTNKGIERFRDELELLRRYLGEDYLERIEKRIKDFHSQIIIAIENINAEV